MPWYTTSDAVRDANRQRQERERAGLPSPKCSTFCATGERCAITGDGKCDALSPTPPQPEAEPEADPS